MEFCWPKAFAEIDWSKEPEFLEQELYAITGPVQNRVVDKLIKVWLLEDNKEAWILIHLEVQGQKKKDFSERLFIYRYRLYERFRKPVATLAILIDKDQNWRPMSFCKDILALYKFIDGVLRMPRAFELKYHQEVELFEKENDVSYITTAERIGLERGLEEGIIIGEGKLCLHLLEKRFGMVSETYRNQIQTADAETIEKWGEKIYDVDNIESVFNK